MRNCKGSDFYSPMNNQVITQNGKKYDYRVFNNFGENPKNDRPANEYKLTVTRLPEMAKETRQNWRP